MFSVSFGFFFEAVLVLFFFTWRPMSFALVLSSAGFLFSFYRSLLLCFLFWFRELSVSRLSSIWQRFEPSFLIKSKDRSGGVGEKVRHFLLRQVPGLNPLLFFFNLGLLLTSLSTRGFFSFLSFFPEVASLA